MARYSCNNRVIGARFPERACLHDTVRPGAGEIPFSHSLIRLRNYSAAREDDAEQDGDVSVTAGYAWDGCTLKFCVLDVLIGIPDGAVYAGTGEPKTYYASLVHDALYQFLPEGLPYTRKEIDQFFLRFMRETGFALRHIYYLAVRVFGRFAHWLSVSFRKKTAAAEVIT